MLLKLFEWNNCKCWQGDCALKLRRLVHFILLLVSVWFQNEIKCENVAFRCLNMEVMFCLLLDCREETLCIFVNGRICSVCVCVCVFCVHTHAWMKAAVRQHQQRCEWKKFTLCVWVCTNVSVCACVCVCVGVCVRECKSMHVSERAWGVKRRLFAGMENAKISRCCWTIRFTISWAKSVLLRVCDVCVCVCKKV